MDRYRSSIQRGRQWERRYRQVLEEEQESLERNKKLLEDIDRLEQQMKYFNDECRQDDDRLRKAKDKFLKYVKSVYPKWTEDVKKWQEEKRRPHSNIQNRNNGIETGCPRDTMGSHRDTYETWSDRMGYPKDIMGSSRDSVGYSMGMIGDSRDEMRYTMNTMRSSHDRKEFPSENSRNETKYTRDSGGFASDQMGYPRSMYNGQPWIYPQYSPLGIYPHSLPSYFQPMPAYGAPRWSTPGPAYDHWSMSNTQGRSFHEELAEAERNDFSKNSHHQNMSLERGDPNIQREALPNVMPRNGQYTDPGSNRGADYKHRDLTAENSHYYERYSADRLDKQFEDRRQYADANQGLGRLNHGSDNQKSERGREGFGEARGVYNELRGVRENREHGQVRSGDRGLFKDNEGCGVSEKMKGRDLKEKVDGMIESDLEGHSNIADDGAIERSKKRHGGSMDEDQAVDTTTNSDHLDELKHRDGGKSLGEAKRVMQLRSEGSGFGSREAVNTDSISLPTIHQYEGDIRDVFSDLSSSSEALNQDTSSRGNAKPAQAENLRKVSQDSEVGKAGDLKALTREVSAGGNRNVVEDLLGDDVSDFEVSETELSDGDLGARESAGVSGNASHGHAVQDKSAEQGGLRNGSLAQHHEVKQNVIPDVGGHKEAEEKESKNVLQRREDDENVVETGEDFGKENDVLDLGHGEGLSHSSDVSEELARSDTGGTGKKTEGKDSGRKLGTDGENKVVSGEDGGDATRHQNISDSKRFSTHLQRDSAGEEGKGTAKGKSETTAVADEDETGTKMSSESGAKKIELDEGLLSNPKENITEENQSIEEEIVEDVAEDEVVSEDEKSKSGILDEVSFSSVESSFESNPAQEKDASRKSDSKRKESVVSYNEDFEDEVPLTQSAAYRKMLSSVDLSDEGEDLEEEFLQGTMSEANTTGQSTSNMPAQTLHNSGTPSQVKPPAKSSKSKPTLALFSSGERNDFGSSFGNENEGALSVSWKSSEGTLSPPLSPDTGGHVPSMPSAGKVENRQEETKEVLSKKGEESKEGKEVLPMDETEGGKGEIEKKEGKLNESNTKSRIQAGFWNHSDTESEVDLQISHGAKDNDDDDFDFYS